jgi:hypothetical protein
MEKKKRKRKLNIKKKTNPFHVTEHCQVLKYCPVPKAIEPFLGEN